MLRRLLPTTSAPLLAVLLLLLQPRLLRADVTLVQDGQPRAAIFVDQRVMQEDLPGTAQLKNPQRELELQRQRLRESVRDLAAYLQKMSGAEVAINPAAESPAMPVSIHVGNEPAGERFPVQKPYPYAQGFRLVVQGDLVALVGESDLATSYAIYELLDRLGCRWYMPSEMGQVIPRQATIALPETDESLGPGTSYRTIWYADEDYKRRNRMGGLLLEARHALEITGVYLTEEDKRAHPEWLAEYQGKPNPNRIKWSNAEVAAFIADKIVAMHAEDPQPSYSISPDDGGGFDESEQDRALDAGDFDRTYGETSITDRYLVLCNRIAERVTAQYPDVLLGFLAYSYYARPPVREEIHPNLVPQVAPITYSRAHPMNMDEVPDNETLRYLVKGWGEKARQTSWYFYGFFLAEVSAPFPTLRKWGHDVPYVLREGNCRFWQPETMPNFEYAMHALYMANRLAWDPSLDPQPIYDEINRRFYGAAAEQMTAYWDHIDRCWVETDEYSGCGFGHMRRFTPQRLAEARELMDAALAAAQTEQERFRVGMADDSLGLLEGFMKLRRDLAEGRFKTLAADAQAWKDLAARLGEQYEEQSAFVKAGPTNVNVMYFDFFFTATYQDATRVATQGELLTREPLREWRYKIDPDRQGEAAGWAAAGFDDGAWETTDVAVETWSTLGLHNYLNAMWYRTRVDLPEVPAGKKVFLWLGSTDGSTKVFVNGRHVPFHAAVLDEQGQPTGRTEPKEQADGFCQPFSFDITDAIRPGENTIAILAIRPYVNELGTGGLLSPAVIYSE